MFVFSFVLRKIERGCFCPDQSRYSKQYTSKRAQFEFLDIAGDTAPERRGNSI
jgi:hypothetical protein